MRVQRYDFFMNNQNFFVLLHPFFYYLYEVSKEIHRLEPYRIGDFTLSKPSTVAFKLHQCPTLHCPWNHHSRAHSPCVVTEAGKPLLETVDFLQLLSQFLTTKVQGFNLTRSINQNAGRDRVDTIDIGTGRLPSSQIRELGPFHA